MLALFIFLFIHLFIYLLMFTSCCSIFAVWLTLDLQWRQRKLKHKHLWRANFRDLEWRVKRHYITITTISTCAKCHVFEYSSGIETEIENFKVYNWIISKEKRVFSNILWVRYHITVWITSCKIVCLGTIK